MRLNISQKRAARRGVILLVVITLLALFAIVGIAFIYYAQAKADSSRVFRETQQPGAFDTAGLTLQQLFDDYLRQWIYDVSDQPTTPGTLPPGAFSAMRGHSLARTLYGWNDGSDPTAPLATCPNTQAFNGTGRLHASPPFAPVGTAADDEYYWVNYTWFPSDVVAGKTFVRDPEWTGTLRTDPTQPRSPTAYFTGGFNAPYTYTDFNTMCLAGVKADGTVMIPSFFREGDQHAPGGKGFGSMDPANTNWTIQTDPTLKYKVLRPRPGDNFVPDPAGNPLGLGIQPPPTGGGDVQNLKGSPGTYYYNIGSGSYQLTSNDSFWMDINSPIQVMPNGTKYKALYAALIVDLDNRVNLNVAGNVVNMRPQQSNPATIAGHFSNQGWGPWEVNLNEVLPKPGSGTQPEWSNLFLGNGSQFGRYGQDAQPGTKNSISASGNTPHFYGQVDYDGCNELSAPPYQESTQIAQPVGQNCFPTFATSTAYYGFGNCSSPSGSPPSASERGDHPGQFNFFQPTYFPPGAPKQADDLVFDPQTTNLVTLANMRALLRDPSTVSEVVTSKLGQLCPANFADPTYPKSRRLVTTLSYDLDRPGLTPWVYPAPTWGPAQPGQYGTTAAATSQQELLAPTGQPIGFPALSSRSSPPQGEFAADWRAINTALSKVDLNRFLRPYPHQGTFDPSNTQQPYSSTYLVPPGTRFDDPTMMGVTNAKLSVYQQYQWAEQDRQLLATDIYNRLVAVTGVYVPPVVGGSNPTDDQLQPLRWLAQLAVNIVDFIDEDDISTPFNFYPYNEAPVPQPGTAPYIAPVQPKGWVFGTELPRVLLNEVLAENQPQPSGPDNSNNVWVELVNPAAPGATPATPAQSPLQQMDGLPVQLYQPVAIATSKANWTGPYATYQVGVTWVFRSDSNVPATPPYYNWNPLGDPDPSTSYLGTFIPYQTYTLDTDFAVPAKDVNTGKSQLSPYPGVQIVSPYLAPGSFLCMGPNISKNQVFKAGSVPAGTLFLDTTVTAVAPHTSLQYSLTYPVPNPPFASGSYPENDPAKGVNVVLRRLANPYVPHQPDPTLAGPPGSPTGIPYNPYVTVDYMDHVVFNNVVAANADSQSVGKRQPYAVEAAPIPQPPVAPPPYTLVVPQVPPGNPGFAPPPNTGATWHSFGTFNNPGTATTNYDWLVHLDRQVISPLELLHVSGQQPWQLTHRFITNSAGGITTKFTHTAPWFDNNGRLYRALEFLETHPRGAGMLANWQGTNSVNPNVNPVQATPPRVPGKVNINTIWDVETFRALCDPQTLAFTASGATANWDPTNQNGFQPSDVDMMFQNLVARRTPTQFAATGGIPAAGDLPFLSLSTGYGASSTQNPNGISIENTILRSLTTSANPVAAGAGGSVTLNPPVFGIQANSILQVDMSQDPTGVMVSNQEAIVVSTVTTGPGGIVTQFTANFAKAHAAGFSIGRLLEPIPLLTAAQSDLKNNMHPYFQYQLMNKLHNNITTRSNVFALWLTVGFFQVYDRDPTNPATVYNPPRIGQEIGAGTGQNVRHHFFAIVDRSAITIPDQTKSLVPPISTSVAIGPGTNQVAQSGGINAGNIITIEPGGNQETVIVTGVDQNNPPKFFTAVFNKAHPVGSMIIVPPFGNPGPQPMFQPIDNSAIVQYYAIID